jgi:hypothetical protein
MVRQFDYFTDIVSDGITLAVVAIAISVSMAKILAKRNDYELNPNKVISSSSSSFLYSS